MDLIPIFEGSGLTLTKRQKDLIPIRTEAIEFRELKKKYPRSRCFGLR